MSPVILAIESSCDETAAAVFKQGKVVTNIVATQSVHKNYGGVVPEMASRAHLQHIIPVVNDAMAGSDTRPEDLNAVAFTQGPGLLGALMVGASFAKGMALAHGLPLIGVHHMKAHVLAHFIDEPMPEFPFLCLTVSGGHTQILKVEDPLTMEILGQTCDDAVGEAYDKTAKILGLSYPGGPILDALAQKGNPDKFPFPQTNMPNFDFSFSGIKTAVLYFVRDQIKVNPDFINEHLNDLCAGIQKALVGMLMQKLEEAVKHTGIRQVAIAGGVAANSALRAALNKAAAQSGWQVFIPEFQYCTDNAAMVARAAAFYYDAGIFVNQDAVPLARFPF